MIIGKVGQGMLLLTLLPSIDALIKHSLPECLWSSLRVYTWFRGPNAGIVYEPGYQSHCQSLPHRPLGRYKDTCGWLGQIYRLR